MLEFILGADSEVNLSGPFLGDLQNAVAPVVGSLGVLHVVDSIISNNERVLEISRRVSGAQTDQSLAIDNIKKKNIDDAI